MFDMLCENFKYSGLIKYFEEISAIPRASYNEKQIADYLCDFAASRSLEYYRDELNNVLINKPATAGCENKAPVMLQGHTDMVCEKNADVEHDFDRDGLKLYEEDGWIRARGTTLGADDGVAVAVMLCILDGGVESHGPIQCLFTASEETGLDGAQGFDYSRIYARRMLNMDGAEEELVIAACAGGLRSSLEFEAVTKKVNSPATVKISLKGLFGGHSGEDIHKGRANANKLMGRVLYGLVDGAIGLVSVSGGSKDNAIPRECEAVLAVADESATAKYVSEMEKILSDGLCNDDKNFTLTCEVIERNAEVEVLDTDLARKIVFIMHTVPNGIFDMNNNIVGIVEWSRNFGVVSVDKNEISLVFASRSSFESRIDESARELDDYARMLGAKIRHYNRYPGWSFAKSSELQATYSRAYKDIYGKEPIITGIHAGLECGFISEAVSDMDIICCAPTILDLHSPDERLNIASFERFFSVIKRFFELD